MVFHCNGISGSQLVMHSQNQSGVVDAARLLKGYLLKNASYAVLGIESRFIISVDLLIWNAEDVMNTSGCG